MQGWQQLHRQKWNTLQQTKCKSQNLHEESVTILHTCCLRNINVIHVKTNPSVSVIIGEVLALMTTVLTSLTLHSLMARYTQTVEAADKILTRGVIHTRGTGAFVNVWSSKNTQCQWVIWWNILSSSALQVRKGWYVKVWFCCGGVFLFVSF